MGGSRGGGWVVWDPPPPLGCRVVKRSPADGPVWLQVGCVQGCGVSCEARPGLSLCAPCTNFADVAIPLGSALAVTGAVFALCGPGSWDTVAVAFCAPADPSKGGVVARRRAWGASGKPSPATPSNSSGAQMGSLVLPPPPPHPPHQPIMSEPRVGP